MLNIKYTIQSSEEGSLSAGLNPNAYGNAWLVEEVISCRSADDEIRRLATENLRKRHLRPSQYRSVNLFWTVFFDFFGCPQSQ